MSKPEMIPFITPHNGEKYGEIAASTLAETQQAMKDMRISARIWNKRSVGERARALKEFQGYLIDRSDEIAAVISRNTGKSRQDGLAEVFMTVDMINHYCSKAKHWLRPRLVRPGISVLFKLPVLQYRPRGVVAIIGPWNYPFNLNLAPIVSALLAGNTVVCKPSEVAADVGRMIDEIFQEFMPLAPFVRILHGDGKVGAALVESQPDYIYLTGSVETAKKVMANAAKNLIPCGFELGGKDPAIILEDANLREAARWTVWGAVYNAGQSCMAIERVYVVDSVYDEFVRYLVEETQKIRVGYSSSLKSPYHYGPFTFDRQLHIVETQMTDAIEKGATVLTGGDREGMFYEPTILTDVNHQMLIMQDENFGPIIPVVRVRSEREAIQMANDSHFGLGASVWSKNLLRAYRVGSQVHASSVIVNDAVVQFTISTTPYGGIKQSGNVSSHGEKGLLEFTVPQVVNVGPGPQPYDIATMLRAPGTYKLQKALMTLLFGTTAAQKLEPFEAAWHDAQSISVLSHLASAEPEKQGANQTAHPNLSERLLGTPQIQPIKKATRYWLTGSTLSKLAAAAFAFGAFGFFLGGKRGKK